MLPELFRLWWWVLIHRKARTKAGKSAKPKRRPAHHKKTAGPKSSTPAPRSGKAHHPKRAHHPRPATHAA